jgi:hypothetical protein
MKMADDDLELGSDDALEEKSSRRRQQKRVRT